MLNEDAVRAGFGRTLPDKFFDLADPDGRHLLDVAVTHGHASGGPRYRCYVRAHLAGTEEPTVLILDVDPDTYAELPDSA